METGDDLEILLMRPSVCMKLTVQLSEKCNLFMFQTTRTAGGSVVSPWLVAWTGLAFGLGNGRQT